VSQKVRNKWKTFFGFSKNPTLNKSLSIIKNLPYDYKIYQLFHGLARNPNNVKLCQEQTTIIFQNI